jgi:hypothetical protein
MLAPWTARVALVALSGLAAGCAHAAAPSKPRPPPAPQAPHASVTRAAAAYATLENAEVERLSGLLDGLLTDPELVAAFKARDRETLYAKAKSKYERLEAAHGITHWYFLEPEPSRACFLRVHSPTLFGDVVQRDTLTRAIATKEIGSGKELGKTAFALRVVKPIRFEGAVIGYMELGEEISHFLVKMKEQTGDDFGVLVDKSRVDRAQLARVRKEDRWDERPDVVLIDSTVWNERLLELPVPFGQIPDAGVKTGEWTEGSQKFLGGAFPIRDAAGKVVGVLYVRHPLST